MAAILLDISRSFARAEHPAATGIDRVESAYFNWALTQNAVFLVRLPGRDILVTPEIARQALCADRPSMLGAIAGMNACQSALLKLSLLRKPPVLTPGFTYLNVGHSNLKSRVLASLRGLGMGRFIAMLHDVIPLDHPSFCRPDQRHATHKKAALIAQHADMVLTVSRHSAARIRHHFPGIRNIHVAPPGIPPSAPASPADDPSFTLIGTLEPRKNIAFILTVWDALAKRGATPKLHLIGRRGWESPAFFNRLDAAKIANPNILEHNALNDECLAHHLSQSWAHLFPTLDEGFGIPLYEARAMGIPTFASDLPVLRENGGDLTCYLPKNDLAAWVRAITIAQKPSAKPCAVPTWTAHFAALTELLAPSKLARAS